MLGFEESSQGLWVYYPIMEHQVDKNMETDMKTGDYVVDSTD